MNRLQINRILFAILCLTDLFILVSFHKLEFVNAYITAFMGLILAIAKYPIYEVCFAIINKKFIDYSIKSVLLSIAFDMITAVLVIVAFFKFHVDVLSQIKFFTTFITVGIKLVFIVMLLMFRSLMVINISIPTSMGSFW